MKNINLALTFSLCKIKKCWYAQFYALMRCFQSLLKAEMMPYHVLHVIVKI